MTNPELDDGTDYYALLGITRSASPDTIKGAYHRALLLLHPDKQRQNADDLSPSANIGLLQDAFLTLSTTTQRAAYDAQYELSCKAPRPAQVVSLEDFDCSDSEGPDGAVSIWSLACRCGGMYKVTEDDLERGRHLVGCENCSEVVWVGYEVVEEVSGKGTR
jgi:diphthamide biosynthesis protein 4